MKKYTRLLIVFALVFVMVASLLTACQVHEHTFSNDWSNDTQYHWHAATCEHSDEVSQKGAHEDLNNDGACDVCGFSSHEHTFADEWSTNKLNHWKEATCGHDVVGSQAAHADGDGDGLCDTCFYECGDHDHTFEDKWSYDGDFHWHNATCIHDYAVKSKGAHTGMSDFICDVCGYVSHEHTFEEGWTSDVDGHWHKATCEHEDTKVNYAKHIDENTDNLCDVCQFHLVEKVEYIFDPNKYDIQTLESDLQVGMFTVSATTQIRSRNKSYSDAELGTLDLDQSLKLNGNKAAFTITLSGPAKVILLVRNGSGSATNGQTLNMYVNGSETPEPLVYEAKPNDPMVRLDLELEAGTYKFMCSGTTDLHYAKVTAVVEKSNLEKIEVSNAGTIDYVIGSVLDTTGLIVEKVYENGRREVIELDADAIDDSAFNKDAAGVYTISIKYTENGKEYTTSYQVTVYSVDDITLNENAIRVVNKEGEDKAASKYNGSYANSHLRHIYLKGEELSLEGLTVTVHCVCGDNKKDFIYRDGFTTSGYDKNTIGEQTITVALLEKSKTFTVHVVEADVDPYEPIYCSVDGQRTALYSTDGSVHNFKAINDALAFLEELDLPADTPKRLTIAAGTYYEKVEVTIPNLTLVGVGVDKVIIEWDSLYGLADESGFVHETDSTATFAVRYNAEGFMMSGVTVSNYWNNQKVFDDNLGEKYGEHRALAFLCQADKVVINECKFLGYQDTVEFFTGRQLILNSYISGTTDFIFGSNSTTYFYQCQIHSIETFDNKGGYITAFKGNNGGSDSAVKYGAVFDTCTFTCDENVAQYSETDPSAKGLTAIGRPWGQDAAVAVVNSNLGAHISKAASTGVSRQERYVTMSGSVPEKANFIEFNNTGLSAITESQKGVTVLTDAAEAANYSDPLVLFAATNGAVQYDSAWVPTLVDCRINVKDSAGEIVATRYVKQSSFVTFEQLVERIDAPEGYQVGALYIDEALTKEFDFETAVTGDLTLYVGYISEDPTIRKNTTIDLTGLAEKIEGTIGTYGVITVDATTGKFALNNSKDWVQMNKGTILTLPVLEGSKVLFEEYNDSGLITVTVEGGIAKLEATDNTYIKSITIIVPYVNDTTIDLTKLTEKIEKATGYFDGIYVDATNGKFALNSSKDWVQINADTVLTFNVAIGSTLTFVEYNDAGLIECTIEGTLVTIKATGNTYIKSITIDVPFVFDCDTTIDMSKLPETIEGKTGSYENIFVDARSGKLAPNGSWAQFNNGTILTFNVVEGSTVTFTEYDNAGLITATVEGTLATITAIGNTYIGTITIKMPVKAVTYTLDITQIGKDNLTENLVIGDFFTATLQVKSESIKITGASYEADGLVFDGRQVSLTKGKVQVNDGVWSNSISFTVAEGQTAKVVIYAAEKSDKQTTLKVMNEAGETVTISDLKINGGAADAFDTLPIDKVHKYEFTLSAGTYHIGGAGGGAYIYGMSVTVE